MRLSTSLRLRASFLNSPRKAEVTITDPGFLIPRIVMQLWEACKTTATSVYLQRAGSADRFEFPADQWR